MGLRGKKQSNASATKLAFQSAKHPYNTRFKLRYKTVFSPTSSTKVSKSNVIKARRQGLVPCQGTREMKKHAPYLTKDIMFSVLVLLPVQVLHSVIRYVCSEWRSIIREPKFAIAHFQLAHTGILIHVSWNEPHPTCYVKQNSNGIRISELKLPFGVCYSCNGLLLLHEWSNSIFHVVNPVTKIVVSLPKFHGSIITGRGRPNFDWERRGQCEATLAYTSHGLYKVVFVYGTHNDLQLMICNVADASAAWRPIDVKPVCLFKLLLLCSRAYFIGRYVYWLHPHVSFGSALDVDTEKMYKFPTPKGFKGIFPRGAIVNMGKTIGMVEFINPLAVGWWWKIWELTDTRSGKWANVATINMIPLCNRLHGRYSFANCFTTSPVLYLADDGVLWIHVSEQKGDTREGAILSYNVKTRRLCLLKIGGYFFAFPHVESLLSPLNHTS